MGIPLARLQSRTSGAVIVTSTATDAADATLTTRKPLPSRYRRSQQAGAVSSMQPSTADGTAGWKASTTAAGPVVHDGYQRRGDDTDRLCGYGCHADAGSGHRSVPTQPCQRMHRDWITRLNLQRALLTSGCAAANGKSDTVAAGLDGAAQSSAEKLRIPPLVGWTWRVSSWGQARESR